MASGYLLPTCPMSSSAADSSLSDSSTLFRLRFSGIGATFCAFLSLFFFFLEDLGGTPNVKGGIAVFAPQGRSTLVLYREYYYRLYRPGRVSLVLCNGGINVMVEAQGSKNLIY